MKRRQIDAWLNGPRGCLICSRREHATRCKSIKRPADAVGFSRAEKSERQRPQWDDWARVRCAGATLNAAVVASRGGKEEGRKDDSKQFGC